MSRPSRETLIRYFRGKCLPYEIELVELYLSMHTDNEYVEACIAEVWDELTPSQSNSVDNDLEKFRAELDQRKRTWVQLPALDDQEKAQPSVFLLPAWIKAVAAAVILIAGTALAIYTTQLKTSETQVVKTKDMLPGNDRALLTLSDGSTVSLSGQAKGKIAVQQGFTVENTSEGEIVYRSTGGDTARTNAYNSIATPNGGQYVVSLPDGSKARLNAASSLTYPVHFSGKERRVKMTGEVYFEIAKAINNKNKHIPFFVETDRQEIQVLGTMFNVNAYTDELQQMTTLVEGSVRLKSNANGSYTMLKPGQRALVGNSVTVSDADMKHDLAWINGKFIFQREELGSILRKISRWYDLEVECPPELANIKFTGKLSRNQPISAVIKMISATNKINIQLKERRIIVKK